MRKLFDKICLSVIFLGILFLIIALYPWAVISAGVRAIGNPFVEWYIGLGAVLNMADDD